MEFIKILFNIAFTVLPLLLQLLLQIPAARTTSENEFQNTETTTIPTSSTASTTNSQTTPTTTTTSTTSTTSYNNKNKNNMTTRELRKHEQIIDNSIDFAVDPCDDFYQYACGEWKNQLYDHDAGDDEVFKNIAFHQAKAVDNKAAESDKYERTLAMIDYLADKEVLKYFNGRNVTKKLNTTPTSSSLSSLSSATTSSTTSSATVTTTTTTATTKEPDFIIKVYKYYKSCIAIQQYEPIKYLEWLELNEHVKWPSLINTTTANSEEQDAIKHDHRHDAQFTADLEEQDEIVVVDNHNDDNNEDHGNIEAEQDDYVQDYNSTWINTLAILRKYGMNGIFIEEIIYTTKTFPSKLLLGFDKPIKQGGFKSLKSDNLKIILKNLNVEFTSDAFKRLWLQVTKFEWQLTKLNDICDELGTTMITLEHLPVPWLNHYLRIILNQTSATAASLDLNMRIVITNVAYFMALDDLLNEYDDNFLKQYLQIRFLWHLYQQEPQEFQPFDCILHIKRYMPLAFEWIYEQQYGAEMSKEIPNLHEMYNNLRKQFNLTLYNNKNNFDSSTLEHLVNKLESIQFKVGTFIDIDQAEFFHENRKFYSSLKFSSHEFYFNHMKMLKFNFDTLHFGMRSISTNSLFYDMQEYNAGLTSAPYFNKRVSTINIPISLLQPPVYHKEFSDVYKYSTLGFLLAQTLMYGFNLNDIPINDNDKLVNHVKCLTSLDSTEINDKIADVSGLRLAYHTFFHTTNKNLISNRKIFFLNFAQTFCGNPTIDDNLGRTQVNYGLAQFSEFAKTFECAPDSHMNPHEKCYLWD